MAEECCAPNGNIMILACSGGSNVGQLLNKQRLSLLRNEFGKMVCLAGVGGHLGGFVQSAKDVPQTVAIDGCEIGYAKAILKHAEVPLKDYIVLTGLGIEKYKDFNLKREEIDTVKEAVKKACGQ
jgi:uncharacterized metal-binding protein